MKLPLWRAIAGFGVLAALMTVLISLAPVYLDNYRLGLAVRNIAQQNADDDALRSQVLGRARELNLPVSQSTVKVTHPQGGVHVEANYVVEMNLGLYQVDLHFHPHADRAR